MAKKFIFSEWKNIFNINVRVCVTSRYTAARGQSVRRRSSRSVSRYGPTLPRDADRGRLTHEMEGLNTNTLQRYLHKPFTGMPITVCTLAFKWGNYAAKFTLFKFFFHLKLIFLRENWSQILKLYIYIIVLFKTKAWIFFDKSLN